MNTSKKGAEYENDFKRELYRRGAKLVMRAAASKGPFDLLSVEADAVCGYQLKAGRLACSGAQAIADAWNLKDWPNFLGYVVHKTKEKRFCAH